MLLVAASAAGGATVEPPFSVRVHTGLDPRLDPSAVAEIAIEQLGEGATVDEMTLVPSDSDVRTIEPESALGPEPGAPTGGAVWVVRARGHFVGRRVPPGVPDVRSSTGYFVIEDATGDVRAMGMP